MNKEQFEICSKYANNNLDNKGNLYEFLKQYLVLAGRMRNIHLAYKGIVELPPAKTMNTPDYRVDIIVSMCEENLKTLKSQEIEQEPTHSMSKAA